MASYDQNRTPNSGIHALQMQVSNIFGDQNCESSHGLDFVPLGGRRRGRHEEQREHGPGARRQALRPRRPRRQPQRGLGHLRRQLNQAEEEVLVGKPQDEDDNRYVDPSGASGS